jgi:glycosyltransferase involved in cell wall biosynthesis
MDHPLISILIPYKNTADFLSACLKSIVAQTYGHWELLIVNDHSQDDSAAIVHAFAEDDQRIKSLENAGSGIIDALRKAYDESQGQYVTRMDSDDIMHPQKLELMLKDLQKHGQKHLALGLVSYFSESGVGDGFKSYENWLNALTRNGDNFKEIYKECVIPSPCWMLHRADFEACGAFRSNTYPEDYDLAFRFYKKGLTCIPSDQLLHHWRDHQNRASRTDAHYAENSFLDLKVRYFLELNHEASRPLCIWGAGKKGKSVAKLLQAKKVSFHWLCDNPKKIGKHIYEVVLQQYQDVEHLAQPQIIVAVANPEAQQEIKSYLKKHDKEAMEDYFFFC